MLDSTWIGYDIKTNEHLVVLENGGPAIRVRTVKPKPQGERWNAQSVREVAATVLHPNPKDDSQEEPRVERDTRGSGHERRGGERW